MQLKGVDFLVTFQCNASCKHCGYRAGPSQHGYMNVRNAHHWLSTLAATHPLQSITIHGGEPLLYFPNYCVEQILQKAAMLNISHRGIITNGFWTIDHETARRKLMKLKSCGLTSITFSVDVFHQEFIPFNTVEIGIEEACALGFAKVDVLSHFVDSVNTDNIYNQKTNRLLAKLENLKGIEIDRFKTSLYGRAADNLVDSMEKPPLPPSGLCNLPYWLGDKLHDPKAIEIDFHGNVTLCPGICIGNLKTQSLTDVLRNYNPDKHPLLGILAREGPIGLAKMAAEFGIDCNQRFVDECHLCYEMREQLQQLFPSNLAPSSCYRKATSSSSRNITSAPQHISSKCKPSKPRRWVPRIF